jgi:hypothetical protein
MRSYSNNQAQFIGAVAGAFFFPPFSKKPGGGHTRCELHSTAFKTF